MNKRAVPEHVILHLRIENSSRPSVPILGNPKNRLVSHRAASVDVGSKVCLEVRHTSNDRSHRARANTLSLQFSLDCDSIFDT